MIIDLLEYECTYVVGGRCSCRLRGAPQERWFTISGVSKNEACKEYCCGNVIFDGYLFEDCGIRLEKLCV